MPTGSPSIPTRRKHVTASWFIVDLAHDEIDQAICAVCQRDASGLVAARNPVDERAIEQSEPAFLPANSVVMRRGQRSGSDTALELGVLDSQAGQLRIVSNDASGDACLWGVSCALDNGMVRI
ncbi:MAG TPA: hypothetical protein VD789_03155 [Thermomicrobiales bacterium]|nr:hypothetical protein [Thermomicrobiales bacterium]